MSCEIALRAGLVLVLFGASLFLERHLLGALPDATRDPVQSELLQFVENGWLRWGWFVSGLGMLLLVVVAVTVLATVIGGPHTTPAAPTATTATLTDGEVFFGGAWRCVLVPVLVLFGLHAVATIPLEEELRWRWYWMFVVPRRSWRGWCSSLFMGQTSRS